jgi:hypothetical protein
MPKDISKKRFSVAPAREPRQARSALITEGTPIKLKTEKGSKQRGQERCKAQTKAGGPCQAPAVEGGLCFCHAHPERLAELGRQGGRKNRRWPSVDRNVARKTLRSTSDVASLLEETINRVREGPFDLRAANTIGFLAGTLLKALDEWGIERQLLNLETVVTGNTEAKEAFDFVSMEEPQSESSPASSENN